MSSLFITNLCIIKVRHRVNEFSSTLSRLATQRSEAWCRAIKQMYPHLILDPANSPFPLLPIFKVAGSAFRCACVMPLAPSVAGNLNLAATGRPKGIQISISPDHLKLIRYFVTQVDDVFQSVQHRASSIIGADLTSAETCSAQVRAAH
jgi:hypothetical protein